LKIANNSQEVKFNVLSSDVIIACGVGAGTASEIALAIKGNKPIILLNNDPQSQAFFHNLSQIYTESLAAILESRERNMNKMMKMNNRCLLPFMMVAIASLSSCSSNPSNTTNTISPKPAPSMAQLRAKTNNIEPKAVSGKTVNVTLYTSDVQCQEFVPQKVTVPATQSVTNAVGKIDFNLSGYRVRVRNGIATVDLRLSPQSKRQFVSLSSCEQFALFGSLRKTLTSNSQWKIKEVRFTEQGEDIVL